MSVSDGVLFAIPNSATSTPSTAIRPISDDARSTSGKPRRRRPNPDGRRARFAFSYALLRACTGEIRSGSCLRAGGSPSTRGVRRSPCLPRRRRRPFISPTTTRPDRSAGAESGSASSVTASTRCRCWRTSSSATSGCASSSAGGPVPARSQQHRPPGRRTSRHAMNQQQHLTGARLPIGHPLAVKIEILQLAHVNRSPPNGVPACWHNVITTRFSSP
jgi:hypothetical protein